MKNFHPDSASLYNLIIQTVGLLFIFGLGIGGASVAYLMNWPFLMALLAVVGFTIGWMICTSCYVSRTFFECIIEDSWLVLVFLIIIFWLKWIDLGHPKKLFISLTVLIAFHIYISIASWTASFMRRKMRQRFFPSPHVRMFSHP